MSESFSLFSTASEYQNRHVGPSEFESKEMLKRLGFSNLEELAAKVIPRTIRSKASFEELGPGLSEFETLAKLKAMMDQNVVAKSYIGMGYHDTITPSIILRQVLENPNWYTSYTPYQPEISQGRLESLLNFQTMVSDLTGMEISNASLLDEGTAAGEAMAMAQGLNKKNATTFLASPHLHPHVIEVLKTRCEPLGLKMVITEPEDWKGSEELFAVFVACPHTDGFLKDYSSLADWAHQRGALVIADVDLLAMTLIKPPGDWGADIVIGNSQRFGVPLGNGGPHAAFLATREAYKRQIPGRLVGVSVDDSGKRAVRLTLQTREQHIRREKATSNICTAQALLANMAAFYGIYHGPKGLQKIARRVHALGEVLAQGLNQRGANARTKNFFDTVRVETPKADQIFKQAAQKGVNFRLLGPQSLSISLHEKTTLSDLDEIFGFFGTGPSAKDLAKSVEKASLNSGSWDPGFQRSTPYLTHPIFNSFHTEPELTRYIQMLIEKDVTLTRSMIPLGSCTMKLNAATTLMPLSWPSVNGIHPFAPADQMKGYLEMIKDLENKLSVITGFPGVSVQPNAGSQGEYAGLLIIREYLKKKGQAHRNICLIPSSAHGTNPASAVMAGLEVVVVQCDSDGNIDVTDLRAKIDQHRDRLAALMVTYPSTHGVFEEGITEICDLVHQAGGQVYMDGANLNALVGICRPGEFGPDVCHMNLHKTFAIPHGGGGPGVGPIGVAAHLKPHLPTHSLQPLAGPIGGMSATTSAPWGSASILTISWSYITMMGAEGLKNATLISILNANYIANRLNASFPVLYKGKEGLVAHECILDLRGMKKSGVDVNDVAKRLMDFGFHAPTQSWPVAGTLMVEPTESESKQELDRFIEAMEKIREEISMIETGKWPQDNNPLKTAPHTAEHLTKMEWNHPFTREQAAYPLPWVKRWKFWPSVGRIDAAYGDRNVVCSCPPMEEYQ